jgi:hypothetical protein
MRRWGVTTHGYPATLLAPSRPGKVAWERIVARARPSTPYGTEGGGEVGAAAGLCLTDSRARRLLPVVPTATRRQVSTIALARTTNTSDCSGMLSRISAWVAAARSVAATMSA